MNEAHCGHRKWEVFYEDDTPRELQWLDVCCRCDQTASIDTECPGYPEED